MIVQSSTSNESMHCISAAGGRVDTEPHHYIRQNDAIPDAGYRIPCYSVVSEEPNLQYRMEDCLHS